MNIKYREGHKKICFNLKQILIELKKIKAIALFYFNLKNIYFYSRKRFWRFFSSKQSTRLMHKTYNYIVEIIIFVTLIITTIANYKVKKIKRLQDIKSFTNIMQIDALSELYMKWKKANINSVFSNNRIKSKVHK